MEDDRLDMAFIEMLFDFEQIAVSCGGYRQCLPKRGKGVAGQSRYRAQNLRDPADTL